MSLERQPRRHIVVIAGLIRQGARLSTRKLITRLQVTEVGEILCAPDGIAQRIAIVPTQVILSKISRRAIRKAVEVELLARIIKVDILSVSAHLIHRVLNRPDAAMVGLLGHTDAVPQSPAKDVAIQEIVGFVTLAETGEIEAPDLGVARVQLLGVGVLVGVAAAGDDDDARLQAGEEEGAGGVVRVGHVGDEGAAGGGGEGCGGGGVGPGVDVVLCAGVEGFAVFGDGDAVVELGKVSVYPTPYKRP